MEICNLLPQLHRDLPNMKTNILKDYAVNIRHVEVGAPTSELGIKIIGLMCVEAARGIRMQCGREYGFSESSDQTVRATDILVDSRRV